tara:strand:- start:1935 stop:2495 length:561 start_codon:yes stop_codon:yes gene_type:complete
MNRFFYFTILLFLAISCDNGKHIRKYSIPKLISEPAQQNNTMKSTNQSRFKWTAPEHWILGKVSSMRIGSYQIPYGDKFADLSITFFKGDGGGLLQNINRWRGQLNLEELTLSEVNNSAYIGNCSIGVYKMYKIFNEDNLSRAFLCFIVTLDESTLFLKLDSSLDGIVFLEDELKKFMSSFEFIYE